MKNAMVGLEPLLEMSRRMQERLDVLKGRQCETVGDLQRSVMNASDFSLSRLVGEGGVS